ncbi:MAG: L-2-hydroxyglutarate oxidase [Planctomycetes bacterium]|nr:L-2-hydroxyglutarate oxidase [Planctomycetota bacterium]
MSESHADLLIIGGGLVGLATAWQIAQQLPGKSIHLIEKEDGPAAHQSGHNSGVLHSGIYYKPGSLKATNCREGKVAMEAFCEEHGIAYEICGKVIVATEERELGALENILKRGQENGVHSELIGSDQLEEIEPHVAGIAAIHVPGAGIADYKHVAHKLVELLKRVGHRVRFGTKVTGLENSPEGARVRTTAGTFTASQVIACAGLYSDRIARRAGVDPGAKIVPFRGEYFEISEERKHLCRHLVYPVPDPSFPFLGVHYTRMIDGSVECGPNAVLAFRREGYTRTSIHLGELAESLMWPGFLRLAAKHWRTGCGEMWRSFSKDAFTRSLQKLIPEIRKEDLVATPAGVRAQALKRDGSMVDDFLVLENDWGIHVCNAPSPAATSSLNIGKIIAERITPRFA